MKTLSINSGNWWLPYRGLIIIKITTWKISPLYYFIFTKFLIEITSDLEQFRQKETQNSESKNLSSQSQEMLSLNIQLQSTVLKAQAKQIDLELRKLDATQASEHLEIVQVLLYNII